MATAAEPLLMTVEQYRQLPNRPNVVQELHWGQVVALTFPKKQHTKLQNRLLQLLRPYTEAKGLLAAEFPFRAIPEYDLRAADVAFVSQGRWDQTDNNDNLHGAPELVIEVLSSSNTPAEIREKAALCLADGAEEFWIVHSKRKSITVMRREQQSRVYELNDHLPLAQFGGELSVAEVFA